MKRKYCFLLAAAGFFFLCFQAHAGTATHTCQDIADVYIDQDGPDTNFNDKTRMLVSYHPTKGIARALLKFDIPGGINATDIQSASLHLSGSAHTGGTAYAVYVAFHALNDPFSESADTWNSLSGGDYDASVSSSGTLPSGNIWTTDIDVTTLLTGNLDKVRDNGMMIKLNPEGTQGTWTKPYQSIASRECDNETNPDYDEVDEPPALDLSLTDTDDDGIPDAFDNCPSTANANQVDTDSDGYGDACDNCPVTCNSQQLDADYDGTGDVCDTTPGCGGCGGPACEQECFVDSDGDGIGDAEDNCPAVYNPDQADSDNDGVGNSCDNCPATANPGQTDTDSDGYGDGCDNCPDTCNSQQLDADHDGTGDVCDTTPGCGGCGAACEEEC